MSLSIESLAILTYEYFLNKMTWCGSPYNNLNTTEILRTLLAGIGCSFVGVSMN